MDWSKCQYLKYVGCSYSMTTTRNRKTFRVSFLHTIHTHTIRNPHCIPLMQKPGIRLSHPMLFRVENALGGFPLVVVEHQLAMSTTLFPSPSLVQFPIPYPTPNNRLLHRHLKPLTILGISSKLCRFASPSWQPDSLSTSLETGWLVIFPSLHMRRFSVNGSECKIHHSERN